MITAKDCNSKKSRRDCQGKDVGPATEREGKLGIVLQVVDERWRCRAREENQRDDLPSLITISLTISISPVKTNVVVGRF